MRKRILFISNLFPNLREPQLATFNHEQILAMSHYLDVTVVAPVPWFSILRDGIPSRTSKCGMVTVYHPTYYYPPGVLHARHGRFFLASIRALVRRLARAIRPDAIYASWLYPDGWASARLAQELGLPLFLKVHGTDVNRLTRPNPLTAPSLWAVEQAERVFCVSRALKSQLVRLGAPASRLDVVYNGVDKSVFFPRDRSLVRSRLGLEHGDGILLYVGNLKRAKGVCELAEAFGRLKRQKAFARCRLVIVGKGKQEGTMRSILQGYGVLGDVLFDASQPSERVALWMNAANVLCLPSHMEGLPNVILEALSCGTPVVATRVGGVPEIAKFHEMGLVLPRDVEDLLAALETALGRKDAGGRAGADIPTWSENAAKVCQLMVPALNLKTP